MCGICGIAGPGGSRALIQKMSDAIAHRGPDGQGIYEGEGVCLGHRRLSIIDLVTGDQPMTNEDRRIWVVFNGEIYNFMELRRDLTERGHRFATQSDTEVLIHGYEEYGLSFLPKLDGIFAYALWDDDCRRLLLVRDYFGVKPLHYQFDGKNLRFASEIKSILQDPAVPRRPDNQSLHYFLNLRYIPAEGTLFTGSSGCCRPTIFFLKMAAFPWAGTSILTPSIMDSRRNPTIWKGFVTTCGRRCANRRSATFPSASICQEVLIPAPWSPI